MKKYKIKLVESLAKVHPNTKNLLLINLQNQQEKLDKSSKLDDTLSLQDPSENEDKKDINFEEPYDLKLILQILSEEKRSQFLFNKYKHKVVALIQEPYRLNLTFKFLSEAERKTLFAQNEDNIINLIKTSYDVKLIFEFLSEAERKIIFEKKEEDIINLIKTSDDLYFIFQFLPKEKQKIVLQKKKGDLAQLIKTDQDLNLILQCVSIEEHTTIYEEIKNQANEFKEAFLNINYCFIGIDDPNKYVSMYSLLLNEPLMHVKNCINRVKKELGINENLNHSEDKNNEISENHLHSVVTDIKDLINHEIWHKKGIYFFGKKTPDGIKTLINLLNEEQSTEVKKLIEVKAILTEKCKNRPVFRMSCTHKFYKDLLAALEPCVPYEQKQNKIKYGN